GEPPPEFYDSIIYDYNTNSITYETPAFPPFSMISAMSYIGPPEEAIPGYNIVFLIISIATITAFIIKKRRN
ncbi:MAG: Loki-CTERM sorting domain-containing protein, partial [Promethearchaeota archaeon]